ncbi:hypothetical protein FACS1894174_00790 [Bacteroidia bacterium]|nr:hypothetical protein FACS1894174_00790 [Bacteroidia bacterium]
MKQASENTFEAVVSGGYKYFPQLGFNRLVLRDDGRARESWIGDEHYRAVNPERIPHGPVDPAVGILKLEVTPGTEANGRFIFRMSVPPLTEDMEPTMVPI